MAGFNLPPGVSAGDIPGNESYEQWREDGDRLASAEMTLRDYFAAKAMQALISGRSWEHLEGCKPETYLAAWSSSAYAVADAMLQERAK